MDASPGYRYEIKIECHLGPAIAAHFPDFTLIRRADGASSLCGTLPDQAALHGALARIRDLGLTLIAVQRLSASSLPDQTGKKDDIGRKPPSAG